MMADFAEDNDWPCVQEATTSDIEEYLLMLQTRCRWFGARDPAQLGATLHYKNTTLKPEFG